MITPASAPAPVAGITAIMFGPVSGFLSIGWRNVPSGMPGARPMVLNCSVIQAAAFSAKGLRKKRPPISSLESAATSARTASAVMVERTVATGRVGAGAVASPPASATAGCSRAGCRRTTRSRAEWR